MTQTAQAFSTEERRSYIGASEIAAIMNLDRYKTPLDVYNEKLGLVTPFEGNNHTERGKKLEAIAAAEYTELTGHKLQRRTQTFSHPVHSFIVGHIDRVFVGHKRLAEIKCPSVAAFRKYQREGLPDSMIVQLQVYMGLTGYRNATWLIFCADAWDLAEFDIEFDETIFNAAINAAVKFWTECVLAERMPEIAEEDKSSIEFQKIGGDVTFRDDEGFRGDMLALREAEQIIKDGEELKTLAKERVLDRIERTYGRYEGFGMRLYFAQQAGRKTFDKKRLAAEHPEIDLAAYDKQGAPFETFRTFFNKGENQ